MLKENMADYVSKELTKKYLGHMVDGPHLGTYHLDHVEAVERNQTWLWYD